MFHTKEKEQGERAEDFCITYGQMEEDDKERIALTAKKLLIAQKTIKAGGLNIEGEEVPV